MADSTIIAIAGLWKLVLCIVILVGLFVLRPVFPRLRRFKRGETVIEMENSPLVARTEAVKAELAAPQAAEAVALASKVDDTSQPSGGANETDLIATVLMDDRNRGESILKELVAAEPEKRAHYEVLYHSFRSDLKNDIDSATKLETFLVKGEYANERSTILFALARFSAATEQTQRAIEYYDKIIERESAEDEKASAWAGKARLISARGRPAEAVSMLVARLSEARSNSSRAILYAGLAAAHKTLGNKEEEAMALEKASANDPSNAYRLFQAAYAESEAGLTLLALRNYRLQLNLEESSDADNNLAVELGKLGMPFAAMRSYKKAADGGNTLALSNIAHAYMRGGFKDEAEAAIKKARDAETYDRNVDLASAELANQLHAEEEKRNQLHESAILFKEVAREYADALLLPNQLKNDLVGEWIVSGGGEAQARNEGSQFIVEWGKQGHRKKLEAVSTNRALRGTIRSEQPSLWGNPSAEPRYGSGYDVIGFVSEDTKSITLAARNDPAKDTFRMTR